MNSVEFEEGHNYLIVPDAKNVRFGVADQHINYKGRVGVKVLKGLKQLITQMWVRTVECWEMFLVNDANP